MLTQSRKLTFARESEMVRSLRGWLRCQDLLWKEEYQTPWGICDFVGVSLSQKQVEKRLSLGQRAPIGPLARVALLNHIPDEGTGSTISFEELTRTLAAALSPEELNIHLLRLLQGRFVSRDAHGNFCKLNGWVPLQTRIVTIELKLCRIRDVLCQAEANLRLAPESYVGLPDAIALRIVESPRQREFEQTGLGLLSVGRRHCEVLITPKRRTDETDVVIQMHCLERFWRTWIRDN